MIKLQEHMLPVYRFILHHGQLDPEGEAASGQLAPQGWIPQSILLPTLGSLPPRDEDTLAWAACPRPPENLTEVNSERFYPIHHRNLLPTCIYLKIIISYTCTKNTKIFQLSYFCSNN